MRMKFRWKDDNKTYDAHIVLTFWRQKILHYFKKKIFKKFQEESHIEDKEKLQGLVDLFERN